MKKQRSRFISAQGISIAFTLLFTVSSYGKTLVSADKPPQFLELYSSQGCSSCPPAEHWLNQFRDHPKLWTDIIPINFHVDYWDYLGWKDPFAQAQFSQRQRQYNRLGHSRNVATPGFMVDGKSWNGWFYRKDLPEHKLSPQQGSLAADIHGQDITVRYLASKQGALKKPKAHIAILSFDEITHIKTGENRNKELRHNFVVTHHEQQSLQKNSSYFSLPSSLRTTTKPKAIVVWLSEGSDPTPIITVADWLSKPSDEGSH